MLGRGQRSHIVKMHYFSENLLYSWTWFKQTKFKVMMTKVGKFDEPSGRCSCVERSHKSHIVKMHYFFKNRLLYSCMDMDQTVMITKEECAKL